MRFDKEIFSGELGEAFYSSRCLVFPNGEGYFEGVKGLGDLSETEVVLRFSKLSVRIVGEKLRVGKFLDGDLHLCGRIRSFQVEDGK
ncbi:MAG: YabP/YqfC family sporulation protein [Clostridia bacterium]|nr:YabP/YqfC family sporulation protein [Clostridia bacterium]